MKKTMYKKSFLLTFVMLLIGVCQLSVFCQKDEQAVRDVINKWDAAYRAMDAKAMAALKTPDYELINRFGDWYPQTSREENERMWAFAFTQIYRGKPGPKHTIKRIRFIAPNVALVLASAYWAEEITLSDGTRIPPHGQTTTFTVVKQKKQWLIAAQTVHNQMKDIDLDKVAPDKMPWNQKAPKPKQ